MASLLEDDDSFNVDAEHICIFAPPFMGKTHVIGQLAAERPDLTIVFIDIENGGKTLKQLPVEAKQRINYIRVPDSITNPVGIETILKILTQPITKLCHAHGKVSCVTCTKDNKAFDTLNVKDWGVETVLVIDSLNQLQQSALGNLTKGKPDTYKPEWDDYRNQGLLMHKVLSILQQAPYHVICTSHEIECEMEDAAKTKKLVPLIGTGPFSRNSPKYFDHVLYMSMVGNKRKFVFDPTSNPRLSVGSRYDTKGIKQETPSLAAFFPCADYAAAAKANESVPTNIEVEATTTLNAASVMASGKALPNPTPAKGLLGGLNIGVKK